MKCKALHKKLIFYLDGDLSSGEMAQIKQHLDQCNQCAAFAKEMRKTLDVVQNEKPDGINPFFYTRLKAKMESQAVQSGRFLHRPVLEKILQPALFSLLLFAGIYTGIKIGQPSPPEMLAASYPEDQFVPYLNEMEAEPIETFLMEQEYDNK